MLIALVLAGCGSTRIITVTQTVVAPRQARAECQVADGSAEMIFYSATSPVRGICASQARRPGWRAGYQTASPGSREVLTCYLHSPTADVVTSVFDTRADEVGPVTCRSYIDRRWRVLQADAQVCRGSNGKTVTLPPGTRCRS